MNRIILLALCAVCGLAQSYPAKLRTAGERPRGMLALLQTEYRLRAGEIVVLTAAEETVDFVRAARSCVTRSSTVSGEGLVVGVRVDGDQVDLALIADAGVKPGEYTVSLSAEGEKGEWRLMRLHVIVEPTSPATQPMIVAPAGSESPIASTEALISQGWVVPGAFSRPTRAPELQTDVESKFIPSSDLDSLDGGAGRSDSQ